MLQQVLEMPSFNCTTCFISKDEIVPQISYNTSRTIPSLYRFKKWKSSRTVPHTHEQNKIMLGCASRMLQAADQTGLRDSKTSEDSM